MTRPTDADLARWEALAEAATPGPWRLQTCACGGGCDDSSAIKGHGAVLADCVNDGDARLFAASREAVPALVAEVRRLRAAVQPVLDWHEVCGSADDLTEAALACVAAMVLGEPG